MATFKTSERIKLDVWINTGSLHLRTGEVKAAVVDVAPADAAKAADRQAAEETTVEYDNGAMKIKGPRKKNPFKGTGSVTVSVVVPAGSELTGSSEMGGLRCEGELAKCTFYTEYGEIEVDRVGPAELKSGYGSIVVRHATGGARIHAGSGEVRVGVVDGPLTLTNSNGRTEIQQIAGSLSATSSNGDVIVGVAGDAVDVRSSNGNIRIREATRGRLDLKTSAGEVEVGIRKGAVAWLDVHTKDRTGSVRNTLTTTQPATPKSADIEVHALTSSGDIVIRPA